MNLPIAPALLHPDAPGLPDAPRPPAPAGPPAPAAPTAPADLTALLGEGGAVRPWFRRPLTWGLLAAVLLAIGVGGWWRARAAAAAAPSYSTQVVGRGDLTLTVTANGTLQPTRSTSIGSELSGTVLKVNVDVNDRVRKGQTLVELDPAKLGDQVLRARAVLDAAHARVAQTAATEREAGATLARLEAVAVLSGGKVPALAELDAGRAALDRARADGASARASVQEATAALSTDRTNQAKASIRAPTDGVVLTRTVDPGNAVAASLQAVTLFTVAADLAQLRLQVYVDEADVGAVKVDQAATFTVSAFPTRHFPARITRVGYGSTLTDNVVTYLTYLAVDNADLSLRPGMSATATITADHRTDVLLVPNTALRYTPGPAANAAAKGGVLSSLTPRMPGGNTRRSAAAGASTASARQVWVLPAAEGSMPTAVAVTPGISDGRMTEVTAGDLRAGMRVITDQRTGAAGAPTAAGSR